MSNRTFTLTEAAGYLKMDPETLRQKAKAGLIHGVKAAKVWVFIKVDFAAWRRSRYSARWQALQSEPIPKASWHSTNAATPGGSASRPPMDSEYTKYAATVPQATKKA